MAMDDRERELTETINELTDELKKITPGDPAGLLVAHELARAIKVLEGYRKNKKK